MKPRQMEKTTYIRPNPSANHRYLECQPTDAGRLLLALSGRAIRADECPLLGVKRTWRGLVGMSANDPKRTLLGTPRLSARSLADAVLVAEVEEHGGRTPRFGK